MSIERRGFRMNSISPLKYSKKGAAHIEMISSFILFFGFVLFIVIVLRPQQDISLISWSSVSSVYDSFEMEAKTNLTSVFLIADSSLIVSPSGTCFYVELRGLQEVVFKYPITNSYVTDLAGNKISSYISSGNLNLENNDKKYYKVFISPDFESSGLTSCDSLDKYQLGSILEREVMSEKRVLEIKNSYFSDYENLKNNLGVSDSYDFAITFEDLPSLDMKGFVSEQGDIFSREFVSELLLSNGTLINSRINVAIW